MKFLASLLLLHSGLLFAVPHYPIPTEIVDFYDDVAQGPEANCVVSRLMEDTVFGPTLSVYFKTMPSPRDLRFKSLFLYGKDFNPEYEVSYEGNYQVFDLTIYYDACVPIPFGNGCIPHGVGRNALKVVKDPSTGKITEVQFNESIRRINRITRDLNKTWDESGLVQYSCLNGVSNSSIKL